MHTAQGRVVSVHVGRPQDHQWLGRSVRSSIFKTPVDGPVVVAGVNLAGDDQADRKQHGGPDKAIYAFALEDQQWWERELGRPLDPAAFGQNLTTEGLDLAHAVIGERWRIGSAVLQVAEPRTPCWKLGMRMGDKRFPRRFAAARRTGALLRIVTEGVLSAGDPVVVDDPPAHGLTVDAVNRIYYGDEKDASHVRRLTASSISRTASMPRRGVTKVSVPLSGVTK